MVNAQMLTYVVVAALIVFGIFRKNHSLSADRSGLESVGGSDERYTLRPPGGGATTSRPSGRLTRSSDALSLGKHQAARIAYQLEQKMEANESIIQVHDYTSEPGPSGTRHTFDLTVFNSVNTQALNKRIECLQRGDAIEILSTQIVSPVTGSIVTPDDFTQDVSDLLLDDVEEGGDAKFVRDKYAFIKEEILPPEPRAPSRDCLKLLKVMPDDERCQSQVRVYERAKAEYRKQVDEVRNTGSFTQRRLGLAAMDETIGDHKKYPFSHPQSFGFAAHEDAPVDYSALTQVKPMKDEDFFNAVAMENSALAIQYG